MKIPVQAVGAALGPLGVKIALALAGLIGLAFAGLSAAYWARGVALKEARADVDRASMQAERNLEAVKACRHLQEVQNAALVAHAKKQDEKAAAAADALAQARREAAQHQGSVRRLEALLKAPRKPETPNQCAAAVSEIRKELRR